MCTIAHFIHPIYYLLIQDQQRQNITAMKFENVKYKKLHIIAHNNYFQSQSLIINLNSNYYSAYPITTITIYFHYLNIHYNSPQPHQQPDLYYQFKHHLNLVNTIVSLAITFSNQFCLLPLQHPNISSLTIPYHHSLFPIVNKFSLLSLIIPYYHSLFPFITH